MPTMPQKEFAARMKSCADRRREITSMEIRQIDRFALATSLFILLFGLMVWVGTPAHSQEAPQGPPCAPSVAVDQTLEKQYGETITGAGVADSAGFVVLTTNPKTGTFTILMRRPDGMSCIIVGGKGWALADPAHGKDKGL